LDSWKGSEHHPVAIRDLHSRVRIPSAQLPAALAKSLLPCYLVSGDEPLLAQEALDAIRAEARKRGFGAREVHVATTGFDWNEIAAAASSLSLFAEKRILELKVPTGKPGRDGSAAIVDLMQQVGDDLVVLIEAPRLDKSAASSKWVKEIEAVGAHVQVWPVGPGELPGWIATRARAVGLKPDRDAVRLLVDRVEGNLLAAHQEIEKLRLSLGDGPVSGADVESAVADSSRFDVYKLTDAAVEGKAARAIRMLGRLRAEGVEPVIVVWALTRELRTLARVAEMVQTGSDLGSALQRAGVWRTRQASARGCVARHTVSDFYRLLQITRRADAAAKGQMRVDPWQLVTEIVFGLAAAATKAA
jgi:DNA polymerase III subunit delta